MNNEELKKQNPFSDSKKQSIELEKDQEAGESNTLLIASISAFSGALFGMLSGYMFKGGGTSTKDAFGQGSASTLRYMSSWFCMAGVEFGIDSLASFATWKWVSRVLGRYASTVTCTTFAYILPTFILSTGILWLSNNAFINNFGSVTKQLFKFDYN
jgi:hypothetical protein